MRWQDVFLLASGTQTHEILHYFLLKNVIYSLYQLVWMYTAIADAFIFYPPLPV